jgi:hypothetical protein
MPSMPNAFIFVVCGTREHIDTLHFSLKTYSSKTKHPLIVVTDPARNEIEVIHDNVLNVTTPLHLDHHQASIYLKTSLHKILPKGGRYAYMDSDILAVGDNCDQIFDQYLPPIRFALDHCTMPFFSPAALYCGCWEKYDSLTQSIKKYVDELDYYQFADDHKIIQQRTVLKKRLVEVLNNKGRFLIKGTQGFFSWPIFNFDKDFKYNRKEKLWYNSENQPIMTQVNWSKVAKKFNLKYDFFTMKIKDQQGKSIWDNKCDHLQSGIHEKFGVKILDRKWNHWNGGVFIFDDQSHEFLDYWHDATMQIFEDKYWKTRDQGTLIATVWKFNLQDHLPLDEKWNFICDYNNALFGFNTHDGTLTSNKKKYTKPEFVHVYHHFGDKTWDFWNWITKDLR